MELVFIELLLLQLLATGLFARFEVETSALRKVAKWLAIDAVTLALFHWFGRYAMIFPLALVMTGTLIHLHVCRKYGFDPIYARPRKKYYQFRGWKWEE